MHYLYPPTFENGKLKSSKDPVEITKSRIFQTISIVRGELDYAPLFGTTFQLFTSLKNTFIDAAILETLLIESIPESNFQVTSDVIENGALLVTINWELLGTEQQPIFLSLDIQ